MLSSVVLVNIWFTTETTELKAQIQRRQFRKNPGENLTAKTKHPESVMATEYVKSVIIFDLIACKCNDF